MLYSLADSHTIQVDTMGSYQPLYEKPEKRNVILSKPHQ